MRVMVLPIVEVVSVLAPTGLVEFVGTSADLFFHIFGLGRCSSCRWILFFAHGRNLLRF